MSEPILRIENLGKAYRSYSSEWRDMALVFNVVNVGKIQFVGCLWNEPHIKIESLTP